MSNQTGNSTQEAIDLKEAVFLIKLTFLIILALMVLNMFTPTLEEASASILHDHPDCEGQLELIVEEREIVPLTPMALPYMATFYFVECKSAGVKIRIQ